MVEFTREKFMTAYLYYRQVNSGIKRKNMGNTTKHILHRIHKRNPDAFGKPDSLARKEASKRYMEECVQFGVVGIYSHQRDCDHYWFETFELAKPVFTAVMWRIEQLHNDAEGPCSAYCVTPRKLARDRLQSRGERY